MILILFTSYRTYLDAFTFLSVFLFLQIPRHMTISNSSGVHIGPVINATTPSLFSQTSNAEAYAAMQRPPSRSHVLNLLR